MTGTNHVVTFFCGRHSSYLELFLTWPVGLVALKRGQLLLEELKNQALTCSPTFDGTPMPLGQHVLSSTCLTRWRLKMKCCRHPASRTGATVGLASEPLEVAARRERRGDGRRLAEREIGRRGCSGGARGPRLAAGLRRAGREWMALGCGLSKRSGLCGWWCIG